MGFRVILRRNPCRASWGRDCCIPGDANTDRAIDAPGQVQGMYGPHRGPMGAFTVRQERFAVRTLQDSPQHIYGLDGVAQVSSTPGLYEPVPANGLATTAAALFAFEMSISTG